MRISENVLILLVQWEFWYSVCHNYMNTHTHTHTHTHALSLSSSCVRGVKGKYMLPLTVDIILGS